MVTWNTATQHITVTDVVRVIQHVYGHLEHCNTTHHHDWYSQGHTACLWLPGTLQHITSSTEVDTSSTEPQNQWLIAAYLRWQWFPAGDVGGYHSGHRLGAAGWAARLLSTAAGIPLPAPYHATRGAAGKGSVPHQPDPSPWEHDRQQPHWEQDREQHSWEQDRENIPKNRTKNLADNRTENISENRTKKNLAKNRTENNTPEKRTKNIFSENRAENDLTENRTENKLPTNL